MQFGNPLVSSSQFTAGQVDSLYNANTGAIAGQSLGVNVIALHPYVALCIHGAAGLPNCVAVDVQNLTSSAIGGSSGVSLIAQNDNDVVYLPVACSTGDRLLITFWLNPNNSTGGVLSISGITEMATLPPMRSDGRLHPSGYKSASANNVAGGTLLPALLGFRYHLAQLNLALESAAAAVSWVQVNATIGGTITPLGFAGVGQANFATQQVPIRPSGILLDNNTALSYACTNNPLVVQVSCIYDIVPG